MRMTRLSAAALALSLTAIGCATVPAPSDHAVATRSLSRQAQIARPPAVPPTETEAALLDRLDSARRIPEGYILGAMIGPEQVPTLRALGVQVVLSAVRPLDGTPEALDAQQIEHVYVPMGGSFRHAETILEAVSRYRPEEIFIHCRHGADRTGAITAFLLVVNHHWGVSDALYSVVYRATVDIDGLADRFRAFGFDDTRSLDDPTVGFYSVAAAGGVGGLKARNEGYRRLVDTTIEAMLAYRDAAPSGAIVAVRNR